MTCANFQELEAGLGAANQLTISPIDFPYDNESDLRLDIYNYQSQQWVNVPVGTAGGANIDVGGAGVVHYEWEVFDNAGVRAVRTLSNADGGTAGSHPLAPANNNFPVEGGAGRNVRLYRQTSIDAGDMPATFYPGSAIKAEDLNDNFEALRKVVEESACSTNNITDGAAQLDARYWNKLDDTLEAGDAWVADDAHIATTAAGDARWLNATGGSVQGRDMITATETGGNVILDVDLAAVSGLESTDPGNAAGELRIDVNDGCEIVAAGLNAETTDASIVQTGGTNDNPAIRVATTLGTAVTNTDMQITGGGGITVTRNDDTQLTISASAGAGGLSFEGTVDVSLAPPNAVLNGSNADAWTVSVQCLDANVHASWDTLLRNWNSGDGNIDAGDVVALTQDGDGTVAGLTDGVDRIAVGGGFGTLQQVTTSGNSTTDNILLQTGTDTNTSLNSDGSAVFNEQGAAVDFRVESDTNVNMLFVDGSANNVGIGEASPSETLDVRGNIQIGDGGNLVLQNATEDQSVSLNADDATATYNITLPPAVPAAGTRYLRAAGTGTGADQELEWATGGGGATGGNTATQQDYVFQENAQAVRHDYTVGTTLAAQPGSGATTGTTNALSAGPITINNGVTVTIENGSNWVVI